MRFEETYTFDLSEFREEEPVVRIRCRGDRRPDGIWLCSFEVVGSEIGLSSKESRAIRKVVCPLFQSDMQETHSEHVEMEWEGEKKRHPLLQFQAGDTVKYSGENHEVVYVIPESEKCGIRTKEGKLLNNVKFSEIQGVLLKKQKTQ